MAARLETRIATVEDAEAATDVLRRSIAELCTADHHDDAVTLDQWLENKTVERFRVWVARPNRYTIVAERDGVLCGVGMLGTDGVIYLCYVHPAHVRCGVGRALVAAMEDHARSRGLLEICLEATTTASGFYEALGYRRTGESASGFGVTWSHPYEKHLSP